MLPSTLYKGALLNFTETLSEYPASAGWTLHYALVNANLKIQLDSVASDDSHLFNYESSEQAVWEPGSFTYQKYVKKTGESPVLIKTGKTKVEPFFETEGIYDGRTFNQKMLEAVEVLLLDRSAGLDIEYSFKGKSLRSMTFEELIKTRNYFASEVLKEEKQAALDAGEESTGRLFFGFE